ncbi:MliC family protein [Sedimentitalea todarodis]|uniref:MliC family protein n=1 Tax=Sedimentitalea todarodis TaxID=1631240 RepID=A0ABU3VC42_9RHOB|nr:MliC family protein [Sedimentitalea todarodis]MDU9003643.1 MliC family protein [Sedimentitalea todarodis]
MRALVVSCLLMILPIAVSAQDGPDVTSLSYLCERNVMVPVTFINPSDGPALAVMQVEGKQVALRALHSASGVRYVAFDEQDSYRLYTKGDEAFVMHMAADHTAEEVWILRDCAVVDQ